jgi:hypothetical protein
MSERPAVGTFAVTNVTFDDWMSSPTSGPKKKQRRQKAAKVVVHPIFTECAEIVDDSFWADKFTNASYGTFPRYFSYNNSLLTYRKGARSYSIEVSGNPYESASACMEFFRVHGGMFSPLDQQNSMSLQHARAQEMSANTNLTWDSINSKMQECVLSYYIVSLQNIMGLSRLEMEQLRQTIRIGINTRYLDKTSINMENNRIVTITGLLWDDSTRTFYIDPNIEPPKKRSSSSKRGAPAINPREKDKYPQFNKQWNDYVKILNNKRAKDDRRQRRHMIRNNNLALNIITPDTPTTQTVTLTPSTTLDITST